LVHVRVPRLGHILIDRQHARLVAGALAVHAAVLRGRPARALLTRLIIDTRRHFLSEDRLMRLVAYHDEAGHRQLHDGLIHEMLRMREILATGLPLHRKHAAQILDWLSHHTDEADRHLVASLQEKAKLSQS